MDKLELGEQILYKLCELIRESQAGLSIADLDFLDVIEPRPRSEDLADELRSALVSRFDPDAPDGWPDEEISKWPPSQGMYDDNWGRNFNEPNSQAMYLSFTIHLLLYYSEMNVNRTEALSAANGIMARIVHAIRQDSTKMPGQSQINGLRDDYGGIVIPYFRAVKEFRMLPSGSEEEPNFSGKIRLRFLAEYH